MMKLIVRRASARWKDGMGVISTGSGVLKQAGFSLRFPPQNGSQAAPAGLIAAAYAGSFSSALWRELGLAASATGEIVTMATVSLRHLAAGWTVMDIHLNVIARLSEVSQGEFIDATIRAKTNCLVSRLLRANISMNAKLERCGTTKKGGR